MLILKNCEQLIIGLKSLNPIKRMIRETKFTKCLIISEEQKYAKKINRIAKKTKMNVVAGNIETLHNLFDIQDFDLIITIGGEYVHSMINRLNNDNITHYAFETIAGKITSINNNKIPNIIFNPCSFSYDVSKGDIRYWLNIIFIGINNLLNTNDEILITYSVDGIKNILDVLLTTKKLKKQQLIQLSNSDFMVKLVMINIKPTNNNEDQVKKLCSSLLNEKKELINKIFAEFNYSFKYFIDGIKKLEKEVI